MPSDPGLPLGVLAPDFELPDFHGQAYRLGEALARGPVLLIFFRGGWCPYCNTYLRRAQAELLGPLQARGASLAAISSDAPGVAADEVDKDALGFPVLSDPQGQVLEAYNACKRLSDEEYKAELQWHDIEKYSKDQRHITAIPGVILLSAKGRVLFSELNRDLHQRPDSAKILQAVKNQ